MPENNKEGIEIKPLAVAVFGFGDARLMQNLLKLVANFSDEIDFYVTDEGIEVRQMDPSRVAMCQYLIPKHVFDSFQVHSQGIFTLNVEETAKTVFPTISKEVPLEVFVNGKDTEVVFTKKIGINTKEVKVPMLEYAQAEKPPLPKLTFNVMYKMLIRELLEDLESAQKALFDHVTLSADRDALTIQGKHETAKFKNTYKRGSDTILAIDYREESKVTYSLKCLLDYGFPKDVLKFSEVTDISFGTDTPLKVEFPNKYEIGICHWLAPRVEVD